MMIFLIKSELGNGKPLQMSLDIREFGGRFFVAFRVEATSQGCLENEPLMWNSWKLHTLLSIASFRSKVRG